MEDLTGKAFAILLAGGTGTRLWPVSRQLYPKQLVKFIGDDSLVQSTIKRLSPVLDADSVRIVCGEQHFHEIARHMQDIGLLTTVKDSNMDANADGTIDFQDYAIMIDAWLDRVLWP